MKFKNCGLRAILMAMKFEIEDVAWTTQKWHTGDITGVIFRFHGLGAPALRGEMEGPEWEWTRAGALVVYPYYGPWSWMNRSARGLCDELIEKIYRQHHLDDSVPLIMTGTSMGGLSALLYTRYSKRPIKACAVAVPACDLQYHYGERPDVKRTVMCAFQGYSEELEPLLIEHSPLAQVGQLPNIPYFFFHGGVDKAANKQQHSDRMVADMRARGLQVQYVEAPDVPHEEPPQYLAMRVAWVNQFLSPQK